MLDLEYEFRLLKRPLGLPVEVWPMVGFRWQRFDMTAYDGDQIIHDGTLGPVPAVGYHWMATRSRSNSNTPLVIWVLSFAEGSKPGYCHPSP